MSSSSSPPNPTPTAPLQQILLSEEDLKNPQQFVQIINQILQNHTGILNNLLGFNGPIRLNTHLDLGGNRIVNVGPPTSATDAISTAIAEKRYAPPAQRRALEASGSAPLQSYRRLSDDNQREKSSTFLNDITSTAPTANTSVISASAPVGGFVPVTVSSGVFSRTDGSQVNYAQYNDSLASPASFTINTLTRAGNVVSGSTVGANTLLPNDTISIVGAGDASFDGTFALTSASTPNFTFAQTGPGLGPAAGGTVSRFGVYYYYIEKRSDVLFRYPGAFPQDTWASRIVASKDGTTIVAVVSVTGTGYDPVNSAGGGTNPTTNIGAGVRLFGRL